MAANVSQPTGRGHNRPQKQSNFELRLNSTELTTLRHTAGHMNPFKKTILCSALASTLLDARAAGISPLIFDADLYPSPALIFNADFAPSPDIDKINSSAYLNGSTSSNITVIDGANLNGISFSAAYIYNGDNTKFSDMQYNTLTINAGTVGVVSGAHTSLPGKLSSNSITVNDGETGTLNVTQFDYTATANSSGQIRESSGNTLTINGGKVSHTNVAAGMIDKASDNHAIINNGTAYSISAAAINSSKYALAINNSVTIRGGVITSNAYGIQNYSEGSRVISNRLAASGGVIAYDASSTYSNTSNNSLIGNSATVSNTAEIGGNVNGAFIAGGNSNLAQGNSATVSGGKIGGNVHGGHVAAGNDNGLLGNKATVSGGKIGGNVHGGHVAAGNNNGVLGNNATVSNGEITGNVYGGSSFSGSGNVVSGNSAAISDGQIGGSVYGGANFSSSGALVSANKAAISGGKIKGSVYGGSSNGAVSGNSVTVDGSQITGDVYGGNGGTHDVSGNSVTVTSGQIAGAVYGGKGYGAVFGNSVTVSGGVVAKSIYGGNGKGDVRGNNMTVTGGQIQGDVYGSSSLSGSDNVVSANNTAISGGNIGSNVYGGDVAAGNSNWVLGNNTTVSSGEIKGSVMGGSTGSGTGNVVSGNNAAISGGQIGGSIYGGSIYGGTGSETGNVVSGNNAAISGSQIEGSIYGGHGNGAIFGNRVTVSGGEIEGSIYGGSGSGTGDVSGNSVTVSGGQIEGSIYGGHGSGTGSGSGTRDVSGNSVTVNSGQITGAVYGGNGHSAVFGNSVTLGSNVQIGGIVYGGKSDAADKAWNNSLNINGYGVRADGVEGVEHYNFSLNPSSIEVAALSVESAVDMTGSKVRITDGGLWRVGDRATLINNVINASATTQILSQGLSMQYQADIAMVNTPEPLKAPGDTALQLKITGVNLNPQTKAASEGRIAGLAMINQGTDMAVAMGQSLGAELAELAEGDVQGFINSGGTSSRYESGSHVDLNGASLIAGVAKRTDFGLLGGFFEAGEGSYNSVNTFSNAASVKGSGKARYTGLGLLGRYDLNQSLYLDSTLRAGRAGLNFASKNWCDEQGQCADYSSSVAYYGASLAIGYVQPITDKTSVDMRSGVEWAHQKGTTTHIGNDPYSFAATDSKRWVNGVRISHDVLDNLAAYGGVSYEYEFDGKANGSVHGMQLGAPTLKGGTTVAEVGVRATHKIDNNVLSLDVGLQGYEGQRSGFGGQLRVGFTY
jgi:hypothetical protein